MPTLRRGDRGDAVVRLQQALADAGLLEGAVDGSFGPKTEAALKSFQSSHGLTADGIAGPLTWAALSEHEQPPQELFPLDLDLTLRVGASVALGEATGWAAGVAAMVGWRSGESISIDALLDGLGGEWPSRHRANEPIDAAQLDELAAALGLVGEPLAGSPKEILDRLWSNGPVLLVDIAALAGGDPGAVRAMIGLHGDGSSAGTEAELLNPVGGGKTREALAELLPRLEGGAGAANVVAFRASSSPGRATKPQGAAGPLTDGAAIEALFTAKTGKGFIDWFNAELAKKGPWKERAMATDADTRARFVAFWNRIPLIFGQAAISVEQFVALQSIVLNELGGRMTPVAEKMGRSGHPGLAYPFDAISGVKRSYNAGRGNRTALECFNDQDFLGAHGHLPLGAELASSSDQVWSGSVYPQDRYPTEMAAAGIIAEADFCKFRGRGMIQTTFRSAYERVLAFVQTYEGADPTVLAHRERMAGSTLAAAASQITNAQLDDLFMNSDYVIPAVAVGLHSKGSGNYLAISENRATREGQGAGSYYDMGRRVSGSGRYGELFAERCKAIAAKL